MRIIFSRINKIRCCCCLIIRKPDILIKTFPAAPAIQFQTVNSLCTTTFVNSQDKSADQRIRTTLASFGGKKQKKPKKMFHYQDNDGATSNSNSSSNNNIGQQEYQNIKLRLSSQLRKWQTINSIPKRNTTTIERENEQMQNTTTTTNADDVFVQGQKFKIMSYNILAQDLIEQHLQMYVYHNKNYLQWEYRYRQLIAEIIEMRPDILCLQEVQCDHLPMIKSGLAELNFLHLYKKRTGNEYSDGCAIFYRKDLFELIQFQNVQFCQSDVQLLNRNNVAIIAKFELAKHPNNFIIIGTTHLLYNPNRADVRLAQIQILLSELDRLASINNNRSEYNVQNNIPIILTGDFNSTQFSAPIKLITNGCLNLKDYETRSLYEIATNSATSGGGGNGGGVDGSCHQQWSSMEQQSIQIRSSKPSFNNEYFIPRHLGITDNCQHYGVIIYNQRQHTMLDLPVLSMDRMKPYIEEIEKSTLPFNTGNLQHKLYLHSILDEGMACASTFQDEWILVDFIFYSKGHWEKNKTTKRQTSSNNKANNNNKSNSNNHNNKLILLSRYNLPLIKNCNEFGTIPNVCYGSDHLAMACEFYLTIT